MDYDVILQSQKGLLLKSETINKIYLLTHHGEGKSLFQLNEDLPQGAVLISQPRYTSLEGDLYVVNFSKFLKKEVVVEKIVAYLKANNLRFITE